jgi:hypothetical protein
MRDGLQKRIPRPDPYNRGVSQRMPEKKKDKTKKIIPIKNNHADWNILRLSDAARVQYHG